MTDVKMVQIGLTTRCNSNCYFCFREELKRAGRKEGIIDLPVQAISNIIDQGIRDIHFCGNRGEAIFHPEISTIIDIIKSNGSRFEMNTNGGNFDINWWYDLGQKMTPGDKVIFALDGLKNTHEYYRGTNWTKVFENLKAFIAGGGDAIWQMILFKHNEKQVNLIKELSKAIGCSETWIINSRFYNKKYQKPSKEFNKTKEDLLIKDLENRKMNIRCRFFRGKRVYIGVDGSVWPCCYMRCHFGFKERAYKDNLVTKHFKEQRDFNNVLNTPLNDIVNNSKMFKTIFEYIHDDYIGDAIVSPITKKILYKNPDKNRFLRHPKQMINFACRLHCNVDIDGTNRRKY